MSTAWSDKRPREFVWRCRRCGGLERGPGGEGRYCLEILRGLAGGYVERAIRRNDVMAPKTTTKIHECGDGGVGIADLIEQGFAEHDEHDFPEATT